MATQLITTKSDKPTMRPIKAAEDPFIVGAEDVVPVVLAFMTDRSNQ